MSLPDYDYKFQPLSLWWVHDNCEPNYLNHDIIAEYWNVMSSVVFFVPYLIRILILGGRELHPNIRACYKVLIGVGIGSMIYHAYLNFLTQALDMSLIIIAESTYLKALGVELSHKEESVMGMLFVLSLFHPLFPACICIYLFICIAKAVLNTIVSLKGRPAFKFIGFILLGMNLVAILFIPLDILCRGFLYYHAVWHVAIMIYAFCGAISLEVLYDIQKHKKD